MQIQNQDAQAVIRAEAGLSSFESWPQNLLPNVQAVMDMTPRFHRNTQDTKVSEPTTSATSNSVFTSSADKDTFITGARLSYAKDATCDVSDGQVRLRCIINGVIKTLISLPVITLTAQQDSMNVSFDRPVKIDRNTSVSIFQGTFTAGKFLRCAVVDIYEVQ